MLHLKCIGQEMKVAIDERIADKYINANKVHFEFCERWSGMVITAQFTQKQKDEESGELKDKTYDVVVDELTNMVTLPNEIVAGEVHISAFGVDPVTGVRITSIPVKKTIDKSGFVGDGETPVPPTPDLYAQLLEQFGTGVPPSTGANKQLVTDKSGAIAWDNLRVMAGASQGSVRTSSAAAEQILGYKLGNAAFAANMETEASGQAAFAAGSGTEAIGKNSFAEGHHTIANGENQHVQGKFNVKDTANKYAHIVGNGMTNAKRANAHTLDWDGNAWFKGKVYVGGTSMDDAVELGTGGEVDEDAVREIVEEALTEAKENGEFDGEDGYSPTVTLTRKSNGVQIDVQNKDGKQSATVYDGQSGEGGGGGSPGTLMVFVEQQGVDRTVADKTFEEILNAVLAGTFVIAIMHIPAMGGAVFFYPYVWEGELAVTFASQRVFPEDPCYFITITSEEVLFEEIPVEE